MDGKEKSLEIKIRRKIFNFISKHPGIHEREISRKLKIPLSTLDYHLIYLLKRELIVGKSDGHYKEYYVQGKLSVRDQQVFSVLRRKVTRRIILLILQNESINHGDIGKDLGLAASTISFHLTKLVELEIVDSFKKGKESWFFIKDPDYVSDLVIRNKKSFYDDAVDRFVDTWVDLHPKHLHKK